MIKKITCVVLSIMMIIALSGCKKGNKINEYDKETDINVGNGVENQYEEVTDNLNNSQELKVNIEENKTNILSDKKQVVEGIKIDDVTSEEELEIKIKEYLNIFSHDWESGFPKFNDINQLDEMWIWNAVKKYAGQKLNSFTDRKFTKKDLEEIKVGLFGKQLKKEVPEKTREFSKREGNDEYYWNDTEFYEFFTEVYVKKIERNGKKIVAEVIPYTHTYILAAEDAEDEEKIYNLNSECVIEETIVGEWKDTHKIIEKYQERFPRNIIEFEMDEENGNLNIVSCKIYPEDADKKENNEKNTIEQKIEAYIYALNPWRDVVTSIPEFSNINEANKYWIRDCVRTYFRINYYINMYYPHDFELYFQKEEEKIKDILFGEELTNYEYIEPEIGGYAYDTQRTYIKSIEQIDGIYKVTTIPYRVFDSAWEERREVNNIHIYGLTESEVWSFTYTYRKNDDLTKIDADNLTKIEQYLKENEQKFTKQILEIKLDEETGNLHIVSSKFVSI